MGELLFPRFIADPAITVRSAGTHGLIDHPIAKHSGELMRHDGIDPSAFRSRRLTPAIAQDADLILCFEKAQRADIVTMAPAKHRRTFVLPDFANACSYCAKAGYVRGGSPAARLESVIANADLARPLLPPVHDVADPQGKDTPAFITAHNEIVTALNAIALAVR
ncbi:protein-tyrosine-phosphatase [Bifidobacterium avesanii]|nr:protein-tyrosine-phosphatase [Bifidobacterium avesanii]